MKQASTFSQFFLHRFQKEDKYNWETYKILKNVKTHVSGLHHSYY